MGARTSLGMRSELKGGSTLFYLFALTKLALNIVRGKKNAPTKHSSRVSKKCQKLLTSLLQSRPVILRYRA